MVLIENQMSLGERWVSCCPAIVSEDQVIQLLFSIRIYMFNEGNTLSFRCGSLCFRFKSVHLVLKLPRFYL